MNTYNFKAFQAPSVGAFTECFVTVECNGVEIGRYYFKTPEWALFFKRTCEALDNTRYAKYVVSNVDRNGFALRSGGGLFSDSTPVYTKAQVDALLQRITSLEHWLEPLRTKARRLWDALMWGERGRA
jgi:hypothetical protein